MGEWFTTDDFDVGDVTGDPFAIDWSDNPAIWDRLTGDDLAGFESVMQQAVRAERQRIERAIRGAIRAGYDGVDIDRPDRIDQHGIVRIRPWKRPEPNGANGYRTERYTWDWFSEDELTAILNGDYPAAEQLAARGGSDA